MKRSYRRREIIHQMMMCEHIKGKHLFHNSGRLSLGGMPDSHSADKLSGTKGGLWAQHILHSLALLTEGPTYRIQKLRKKSNISVLVTNQEETLLVSSLSTEIMFRRPERTWDIEIFSHYHKGFTLWSRHEVAIFNRSHNIISFHSYNYKPPCYFKTQRRETASPDRL